MKLNKIMKNNGVLYRTRVYLAGNIENSNDLGWRDKIAKKLTKLNIIVLDPTKKVFREQVQETEEIKKNLIWARNHERYDFVHDFMKGVIQKDLRQIDICDFVIIKLDYKKFTAGTMTEITIASGQRKPLLFLVSSKKKMPLWLVGLCNMRYVFEKEEDLIDLLKKLNNGEYKPDTKYWKILVDELK